MDRELPRPVQSPVGFEDLIVSPGLDDRGDARPVGQGQSVAQALGIIFRRGLGERRLTSLCAASRSVPEGSLVPGRRSIRPLAGSGVRAVIPAISKARLFTHAEWPSAAPREDRPVGDEPVEIGLVRVRLRKDRQVPARPLDPGLLGMRGRVGPDGGEDLLAGLEPVQVALGKLQAAHHQVDVGILETGKDHFAGKADDPRAPAFELPDVRAAADADDLAARDRDPLGRGLRGVHGDDGRALDDQLRGLAGFPGAAAGDGHKHNKGAGKPAAEEPAA